MKIGESLGALKDAEMQSVCSDQFTIDVRIGRRDGKYIMKRSDGVGSKGQDLMIKFLIRVRTCFL